MFEIAKKNNEERQVYFDQGNREIELSSAMIEKDFWVTLALKLLFTNTKVKDWFTFKGGTSLSKAYNVINRFSEDIDISIGREHIGYAGSNDPKVAVSRTKMETGLEELNKVCIQKITDTIQPVLLADLEKIIGNQKQWQLKLDPADSMTLLFQFPTTGKSWAQTSFKPEVRIEFGARICLLEYGLISRK